MILAARTYYWLHPESNRANIVGTNTDFDTELINCQDVNCNRTTLRIYIKGQANWVFGVQGREQIDRGVSVIAKLTTDPDLLYKAMRKEIFACMAITREFRQQHGYCSEGVSSDGIDLW